MWSRWATWRMSISATCSTISRRCAKPRHPALHGIGDARAEVHVGGPARRPVQARHRRQGRAQRHGRQGGAVAYGRAWPAPMPPTTPRSGARACCACASWTISSARPRCWRGIRKLAGERLAILTNGGGAGVHGGRPAGRPQRHPRDALRCHAGGARCACCRRPGRMAIRSTSSAMPMPRGIARALEVLLERGRHGRRAGHELPDGAGVEHGDRRGGGCAIDAQRTEGHSPRSRCLPPGSATRPAGRRAGCLRPRASRASPRRPRVSTGSCSS